jgi:hypothetical protein
MAAKSKKEQENGGPVYNFKGKVTVGRDFIGRDQYNTINTAEIKNQDEFVAALQKLQAQILELKQGQLTSAQARDLAVVESQVVEAVVEAQKPRPASERIQTTLKEAKETMEMLGGGLGAAAALGTTLGGLVMTAVKLFGG